MLMMDNFYSFVIAQVFGMYLVVMAIVLGARASHYRSLFAEVDIRRLSIVSNASIWLLIGLFILLIHNLWAWKPYVLVTILGWVIVLKSILWLTAPACMAKMTSRCVKSGWYYVKVLLMAVYGIALLSKGFYFYLLPVS